MGSARGQSDLPSRAENSILIEGTPRENTLRAVILGCLSWLVGKLRR